MQTILAEQMEAIGVFLELFKATLESSRNTQNPEHPPREFNKYRIKLP